MKIYLGSITVFSILFSLLLFRAEQLAEPSRYPTLLDAFWTVFAVLTTVAFADVFPATILGKIVMALTMFSGVALFSFAIYTIGKFAQEIIFGEEIVNEIATFSEKEEEVVTHVQ